MRTPRCGSARTCPGTSPSCSRRHSRSSSTTSGGSSAARSCARSSIPTRATSRMPGAAVVGTGFGARVHVPALRAAGFDVVALVGRDAARTGRRAERLEVPNACTSLADAFALPGVDAVTIAAPPAAHAALAIEACDAGRHVICEKPFALDAAEAEAMLAAATRAGVTALVGHEFRWAPDRALAARAIADGMIGEPRLATLVQYVPLVADPEAKVPEW